MLSRKTINKIKNDEVWVYTHQFIQTGNIIFSYSKNIKFFNEDKTEEFTQYVQKAYKPKLYLSKYNIRKEKAVGIIYSYGSEYIEYTENFDEYNSRKDVSQFYDTEEEIIELVLSNNDIVFKQKQYIYTASLFFKDVNTKENALEMLNELRSNGVNIQLLKPLEWLNEKGKNA